MDKLYFLYDKDGFYLSHNYYTEQPENSTEVPLDKDYIKAKFDSKKWIETASEEDILNNRLIPEQVPLWCIKVILSEMGLTQSVKDALEQLEEPNKTRASFIWEYGNIIKRESQTVEFLGYALQKSKTEIDTIFINANNIEL